MLQKATANVAPLAIVQARAKSIPSFAEKIIRKRRLYKDPLLDMTDLCGGRVITHTAEQVQAVCEFIEKHFEIDLENSENASQRLRPTEFGYRSVHYIVMFRQATDYGVKIPKKVTAGLPADLFAEPVPRERPFKAEVQVRTILEHAWADITHDMTYKSAFKAPDRLKRDFAAIAAVLEEADRQFGRIHDASQLYASNYGLYLDEKQVRREIETLELVLQHDPENGSLATRIATLAITWGDWRKAIATLEPYQDSGYAPALRMLGIALGKCRDGGTGSGGHHRARGMLTEAIRMSPKDAEAVCALADTWRSDDEKEARRLYRQAFELDPTNPDCLAGYLEYEVACQRSDAILGLMAPTLDGACRRCRHQIEAEVNPPAAHLNLGRFNLLLGKPYESLAAAAKAIQRQAPPFLIEAALDSLKRLDVIAEKLTGHEWLRRLLLLAGALGKEQVGGAEQQLRQLATAQAEPFRPPVVIVAGGCDPSVEVRMRQYRELLIEAFKDFDGTVISGGTRQGIAGLVGDVRKHYGARFRAIGYVPKAPLDWEEATIEKDRNRYDEVRRTEGLGFSALEPLQNWIDLYASGIRPSEVRLLGINGGQIAAAEYHIAAALGAQVGLLEQSGRQAAEVFADADWQEAPNLHRIPEELMTVRGFVGGGASGLDDAQRETIAKGIHEAYRREQRKKEADRPPMATWEELKETYKKANYGQADHIAVKLREIGCSIVPDDPSLAPFQFEKPEVERLAQMEHGRWIVDRIRDGWRFGEPRDDARKIHPALLPWDKLPEADREKDRQAVQEIPARLADIGLRIRRDTGSREERQPAHGQGGRPDREHHTPVEPPAVGPPKDRRGKGDWGNRIRFSVFYPEKIGPQDIGRMMAYGHLESVSGEVVRDAAERMALSASINIRAGSEVSRLHAPKYSVIKVTPDVPGLVFDVFDAEMSLWEDMQSVEFRFRPSPSGVGQLCRGWVHFWLESVVLADVPVVIFVSDTNVPDVFRDALAEANARPYRTVFPSYSHEDADVVERMEVYAAAFGDDYLRDVRRLRSGQRWNPEIMLFIKRADVFQLFWSRNSAASPYVEQEWRQGLRESMARPDPYFVRPVYWTSDPVPPIPRELQDIHFARVPL